MDDQHSRSATPRGLLIFIGPAAVIGHRLAAELAFSTFEVGVVDQHDDDLAAHVDALEIVPSAFGRGHAIADEHQWGVGKRHTRRPVHRRAHRNVGALRERDRGPIHGERQHRGADDIALEQGHRLGPLALAVDKVAAGLDPRGAQLADQIIDCLLLAARGRPAPFIGVGRQGLDVPRDPRLIEPGRRLCRGDGGNEQCGGGQQAMLHLYLIQKRAGTDCAIPDP